LVEHDGSADFAFADARIASFTGLKAVTGSLAAQWLGHPAQALRIVAVTGTNGKTSTAWWLAHALPRCAMVGTLGVGLPPHFTSTGMTTPDPVLLQTEFAKFIAAGAEFAAIEASSIGIVEHRLAGLLLILPSLPTSPKTTWTTTAAWTLTGRPRPSCSIGPACAWPW